MDDLHRRDSRPLLCPRALGATFSDHYDGARLLLPFYLLSQRRHSPAVRDAEEKILRAERMEMAGIERHVIIGSQLLLVLLLCAPTQAQTIQQPDVWEPLKYFVGSWEGAAKGQPGAGKVEREYQFVLNGKFLQAKNKSTYPPQEKNPKGEIHEDWGCSATTAGASNLSSASFTSKASSISTRWTGLRAMIRRSSSSPKVSRTFPRVGAQERVTVF